MVSLELMSLVSKVLGVPAPLQVWQLSPDGFNGSSSDLIYLNPQASFLFYFVLFALFAQIVLSKNLIYLISTYYVLKTQL